MNENSELNAHRVRSIRAIVRDGYLLYTNNFKKIFRAVWLIAIVYALAFAWALNNVISLIPTYIVAFSGGYDLKPGARVSVRGFGKFIYDGVISSTKKGRLYVRVRVFK